MSKIKALSFVVLLLSLAACRKKALPSPADPNPIIPATPAAPTKGKIVFELNNMVGNTPLSLDETVFYTLPNGDNFSVKTFNYYLSNVVLIDDNGNRFVETESYHLMMANSPESKTFTIQNVPFGQYKSIEFMIGVDSVRNFSGAQVGALDPKYGMIWSWNTGYIMAKMEGFSPQSSNPDQSFSYHIAGFKGAYRTQQMVQLNLPNMAIVDTTKIPSIQLKSDLATWFEAPNFAGFDQMSDIGVEGADAYKMSQNYASMMSVLVIKNQ